LETSVLYDYFLNIIAQLHSTPQENRFWNSNFTIPITSWPSMIVLSFFLSVIPIPE
jgi:hypothetical protein